MRITKKFKVVINMTVGNVHFHEFVLTAINEEHVFERIKNKDWFQYEQTVETIKGTKVYKHFVQVKNIADIKIVEIKE